MSKDLPPSRTAEQFVVRFPGGMRDRIAESAKASGRSMNAEIVARLEQSFEFVDGAISQLGTLQKDVFELHSEIEHVKRLRKEMEGLLLPKPGPDTIISD